MAEVFGVVAGGFGVASLAIQLVDSVTKLRELYKGVKNAPADIQQTLLELETFTRSLRVVDEQQRRNTIFAPEASSVLCESLSQCKDRVDDLSELVRDSAQDIRGRKRWGPSKAALRRRTFEERCTKLERAKGSLALAYLSYRDKVQPVVLRAIVAAEVQPLTFQITSGQQSPQAKDYAQVPRRKIEDSHTTYDDQMTAEAKRDSSPSAIYKAKKKSIWNVRVQSPPWILGRAWEMNMHHSIQGWNANFRTYNVVPWDSPIFQACRNADIETVKTLFLSGQASSNDEDDMGWTVLHHAALGVRIYDENEPRRFLLLIQFSFRSGVEMRLDNIGMSPLNTSGYVPGEEQNSYSSIIRLLAGNSEDLLASEGSGANSELSNTVEWFNGTHEAMEIILQHCWPPIGDLPRQERLKLAMALGGPVYDVEPVTFRSSLGREAWDFIIGTQVSDYRRKQLILRIGYHLGSALRGQEEEDADEEDADEWRRMSAVALNATADLQEVICDCMPEIVRGYFRTCYIESNNSRKSIIERLRTGFNAWVSWLFEQGMDDGNVEEVGKTSLSKARSVEIDWNCHVAIFSISWLAWGPRQEDWRAWWQEETVEGSGNHEWVDEEEHLAADFWDMIEQSEWPVPGAWIYGE